MGWLRPGHVCVLGPFGTLAFRLNDEIAILDARVYRIARDTRHLEVEMVQVRIFDHVRGRCRFARRRGFEFVPQHVPAAKQRVIWSKAIHPHFHLEKTSSRPPFSRPAYTYGLSPR